MDIELVSRLQGSKLKLWTDFLARCGLKSDETISQTVLILEDGELIATGSRHENILKCIAVDSARRGEDLTAKLLTQLRQQAFQDGFRHLFLYTKPENKYLFSSLFFYPVVQTDKVLLMENQKNGIMRFLEDISRDQTSSVIQASDDVPSVATSQLSSSPIVGASVMNCNPFTLGHRFLIEQAAKECSRLFIFVLSEDKSYFSAEDRIKMVRLGTQDLTNVTVLPTGPYLISSATFPTYFLKERENAHNLHCQLDIEIFTKYFVPAFSITRRYVGTEPLSPMTNRYNEVLKSSLIEKGIEVCEFPRLTLDGIPISASTVRAHITAKDKEAVKCLVPQTTYQYLLAKGLF